MPDRARRPVATLPARDQQDGTIEKVHAKVEQSRFWFTAEEE